MAIIELTAGFPLVDLEPNNEEDILIVPPDNAANSYVINLFEELNDKIDLSAYPGITISDILESAFEDDAGTFVRLVGEFGSITLVGVNLDDLNEDNFILSRVEASDDNASTRIDIPVEIDVLANDFDEGGETIEIVGFPAETEAEGTVALNDNGTPEDGSDDSLIYTPAIGFTGTDSFTYTISNGLGTDTATVTVEVLENTRPIALEDEASITVDGTTGSVNIEVLANDFDPDGDEIRLIGFEAFTTENGGTVTLNDNGTPENRRDDSVDYTPGFGFEGTDSFTYTIGDGEGGFARGDVTVAVTIGNTPPIATDDFSSTSTNIPVNIFVLDNDIDVDFGDVVSLIGVPSVTGAGGNVTISDNGTPGDQSDDFLVYNPAFGFNGTDIFSYTISDSFGATDTGTASVTVTGSPPVITLASVSTTENITLNIFVLDPGNVFDPDGDLLSIAGFTGVTGLGGTVTLSDNGTPGVLSDDFLIYTPAFGFTGTDSFSYTITDGQFPSTATLTVTVLEPPNTPPIAEGDTASTNTNNPVNVLVLANDFDPDPGDAISISGFESVTGLGGTVTLSDNGTPFDGGDDFLIYSPAFGFTGTDIFSYTISDSFGATDTESVTVTVTGTAPVITLFSVETTENSTLNILVLDPGNVFDADGDLLSIAGFTGVTGLGGTVTLSDNGTPGILSDDFLIYTPAFGFTGTDSFSYTIADGQFSSTATLSVTVIEEPNVDPIAVEDFATATAGVPVTIFVLENDSDPDNDPISIAGFAATTSLGGSISQSGNSLVYTPGTEGTDIFSYTISDGRGGFGSATVTINVLEDELPVAIDDFASTTENIAVNIPVLDNDFDLEGPVSISNFPVTTASGGSITESNNGTPFDTSDDFFVYQPGGFTGTDSFNYTITDNIGQTASATVTVTVEDGNGNPIASPDEASTTENIPVDIFVLNNDFDPDPGDVIALLSVQETTVNGGTATIIGDAISYTPAFGFTGTDSFSYTITDGELTGTGTASVTVSPQPDGEPFALEDFAQTTTNIPVNIDVLFNDFDQEGPVELFSVATTTLLGGSVILADNGTPFDGSDDFLVYSPGFNFTGSDSFSYTIADSIGQTASALVSVTVEPPPGPQAFNDFVTTDEDIPVNIEVLANDSDPQGFGLEIVGFSTTTAEGGSVTVDDNETPDDPSDDELVYVPAQDFFGVDSFSYTIADIDGATASATVTVQVADVINEAPIADNDEAETAANTPVNIPILENDTDPDEDDVLLEDAPSVTAAGGAIALDTNGTIGDRSDDSLIYTPAEDFIGTDEFTYTVSDGLLTDTATVTIEVLDGEPTAVDDSVETEGTAIIDVLSNDSDAEGPVELSDFAETSIEGGTIIRDNNGTPLDESDDVLEYTPAEGFVGTDSFTYTISDSAGQTDTATVTVTVINEPPEAIDDTALTQQDLPVTIDVLINDLDLNGDTLLLGRFQETTENGGTVTRDNNETPRDLSDDQVVYTPGLGFTGTDSFVYTVLDGQGGNDTATVSVTVERPNLSPIAQDDFVTTTENIPANVSVLANDSDPDGDPISIFGFPEITFAGNTVTLADNGTPDDGSDDFLIYTPGIDFTGVDSFSYTISDSRGGTAQATVSATVNPDNRPPVAIDDFTTTLRDTPTNVFVLDNDSDPDFDVLTLVGFEELTADGGSVSQIENTLVYTPAAGFTGQDTFSYTITDGEFSASAIVSVMVDPPENLPPIANEDFASTTENTPVNVFVLDNDTDPNLPDDSIGINDFQSTSVGGGTVELNGQTLVYTPTFGFTGPDSFTYTIADLQGATDSATVSVTVDEQPNIPPVANDDTAFTTENSPVNVFVLDNDFDEDNDPLTISDVSATSANSGSVSINGNSISYTPASGFTGQDSFTYTIDDGRGGTDSATVTVDVDQIPNNAPFADNDTEFTTEDVPVTIFVLDNDFDVDPGDAIAIDSFQESTGNGGSISISGETLVYTPQSGFTGVDSFIYTIEDLQGATASATVTVTVEDGNSPPIANDDLSATQQDNPVTIFALDNDNDPDPGDAIALSSVQETTVEGGTATVIGNAISYTPALGFIGSDSFTYTIADLDGATASATVTVNVTEIPPIASPDFATATAGIPVDVMVLDNDFDPNGVVVELSDFEMTTAADGSVTLDDNGTPEDLGDDFLIYTSADDFTGVDSFTYSITDADGLVASTTVTVTVVPDRTPVAEDDEASTMEGTPVEIDVLANDSDPDEGDVVAIADFQTTTEAGGTVIINSNGTIARDDDFLIYTPEDGFTGTDSFTYTVEDSEGLTDTATVTVTVDDEPPVAVEDEASTLENTPVDIEVLANDFDAEGPVELLSFATTSEEGGSITLNNNGTPLDTTDDSVVYSPADGFAGTDSFTYTIADSMGQTASATVTVTVEDVGPLPEAFDDFATTSEGVPVTIAVLQNDSDPEGDPISLEEFPETTLLGGSVTRDSNSTPLDFSDDLLVYTPAPEFTGIDSFSYTISDGLSTDTATVTVDVRGNQPPTAVDDFTTTSFDTPVEIFALNNDSDPDFDLLAVTGAESFTANGGSVSQIGNALVYTPGLGFTGQDSFSYTITDGEFSDTALVTVTVNPPDNPNSPIANPDSVSTTENVAVTVLVLENDFDPDPGDAIAIDNFQATSVGGGTVALSGQTLVYTPAFGFTGPDSFTYTIMDSFGATASAAVSVTVRDGNDAPIVTPPDVETVAGTIVNIFVLDNAFDPDGDPLSISGFTSFTGSGGSVTQSDNGTIFDLSDDFLIYTPGFGFVGTDSFSYTITDGPEFTTATVSIAVEPPGGLVTNNDFVVVQENTTRALPVLLNDSSLGGLQIVSVTSGEIEGDRVIYTAGDAGTDSFSYTVVDLFGQSATSVVEIDIQATGNLLTGGSGPELIVGTDDLSEIVGTDIVRETLEGGAGDDTLLGNNGADVLVGGTGGDVFVYLDLADSGADPNNPFESGDTIRDFDPTVDRILLDFEVAPGIQVTSADVELNLLGISNGVAAIGLSSANTGSEFLPEQFVIVLTNLETTTTDQDIRDSLLFT